MSKDVIKQHHRVQSTFFHISIKMGNKSLKMSEVSKNFLSPFHLSP